jgi:hypothetical protein
MKYKIAVLICLLIVYFMFVKRRKSKSVSWSKPLVTENYERGSKVIVYNSYNRGYLGKQFVKLGKLLTERFCKSHNHVYKTIIHDDDFMSPYWIRVHDLYDMCLNNIDGVLIMYLDADAVVLQHDVSVNQFISNVDPNESADIYMSEDPAIDSVYYPGIFNTGCFIVRNTVSSRKLIKEWLDKYNKGNTWKMDENGKWNCKIKEKECSWSHDGYEQGEFSNIYRKHKHNQDKIMRLHWSALACTDPANKNCYVLHLMGHDDQTREKIFRKLLH